jgi:hypothetical protein
MVSLFVSFCRYVSLWRRFSNVRRKTRKRPLLNLLRKYIFWKRCRYTGALAWFTSDNTCNFARVFISLFYIGILSHISKPLSDEITIWNCVYFWRQLVVPRNSWKFCISRVDSNHRAVLWTSFYICPSSEQWVRNESCKGHMLVFRSCVSMTRASWSHS